MGLRSAAKSRRAKMEPRPLPRDFVEEDDSDDASRTAADATAASNAGMLVSPAASAVRAAPRRVVECAAAMGVAWVDAKANAFAVVRLSTDPALELPFPFPDRTDADLPSSWFFAIRM